ncbi:MAG: winged helix-turn-helix domain-containing protein [Nitratireductor sp.]|nr:winged helix-turn-helix domain-containing protein [Nitratireductor sp.]
MELDANGRAIDLPSRKVRALLAYLALRRGQPVPRDTLVALLWSERGEDQARASLRQSLSTVRKSLGEAAGEALVSTGETVKLESVWVDVEALERAMASASAPEELVQALDLYRGELLEGLAVGEPGFEQWLTAERERVRALVARLLTQASEKLESEGRIEDAITQIAKLVVLDPLNEEEHRRLMHLYARQGRHDAALSQFAQLKRELDRQLGVEPSSETLELLTGIKAQRRRGSGKGELSAGEADGARAKRPALPDKPSIAVIPFINMSADPEQEFFSDGISEDIITELSRYSELFVIARNSSFAFKNNATDTREIASQLGVRYLLEGSVRKSGNRIRVTAQLVDGNSREHVWADRFDREVDDIFAIQDDLARSIVSTIKGRVDVDLAKQASKKPTSNLSAYDCVLQAQALIHHYREDDFGKARVLLEKAVSLDPGYARAHGWLAYLVATELLYWHMSTEGIREAIALGEEGLRHDDSDSRCHLALGVAHLFDRQHDKAGHHLQRASALNPNDDLVMIELARYKMYSDEPLEGADIARQAIRQNPYHPNWYWNILGRCLHTAKDYRGAISVLRKIENTPFWSHVYLAACYTAVGEAGMAAVHREKAMALKPEFSLGQFETIFPYRNPEVLGEFMQGLRQANFPA